MLIIWAHFIAESSHHSGVIRRLEDAIQCIVDDVHMLINAMDEGSAFQHSSELISRGEIEDIKRMAEFLRDEMSTIHNQPK